MKSKFSAIPSIWALACAATLAQQTPPAGEEQPAPNQPKLEIGFGSWSLRGNSSTFRRYATISKGLFIRELSYGQYGQSPGLFGEFAFRGNPLEDHTADAFAIWGPNATRFEGRFDLSEFAEASPYPIDQSRRKSVEASIVQPFGGGAKFVFDYSNHQLDKVFEAPAYARHQRTQRFNGQLSAPVGDGRLEVAASDQRFYDRADFQPDSHARTWSGALSQSIGDADFVTAIARTVVKQDGRRDTEARTWTLDGGFPMGPVWNLQFGFRGDEYDQPEVLNAYVRERTTSYARLAGRIGDASAQFGWKHKEAERVRADHAFVDVPKWNTWDGRLSGRLPFGPRWSIRGSLENLDGGATMMTSDPRRLFWDDKLNLQFRLDHGGDRWDGYVSYGFRYMENEAREIEVSTRQLVIGGACNARENLDFYGEVLFDSATTKFTEPDATVGLDSFFPSSRTATFGANWTIDPNTTLTTSFSQILTDNDNPIFERDGNYYSRFMSAHVRHRDALGREFGLLVAPGRYADRVIRQMGYDATVVMLTARWKF